MMQKKIIFSTPTLKTLKEALTLANKMAKEKGSTGNIYSLVGRTEGNELTDWQPNCDRMNEVSIIVKRGFSPTMVLCLKKCRLFKDKVCDYWNQFRNLKYPGIAICTHSLLCTITSSAGAKADVIIIDEDPIAAFMPEQVLPLERLHNLQIGKSVTQALIDIIAAAAEKTTEYACKYKRKGFAVYSRKMPGMKEAPTLRELLDMPHSFEKELRSRAEIFAPTVDENKIAYQLRLYKGGEDLRAVKWLLSMLELDDTTGWSSLYAGAEKNKNGKIKNIQLRYMDMIQIPDGPDIKMLDATLFTPAISTLFKREFSETNIQVPLANCHLVHISTPFGMKKAKSATDDRIKSLLNIAKRQLLTRDRKVLICTFLVIEEKIKEVAIDVFVGLDVDTIHFGGSRGINKFKDFNAVILLGNLTLNPWTASRRAVALFDDEMLQQEYIRHMSLAEDYQAVHRIRPIYGDKTIVVIGRRWLAWTPPPNLVVNLQKGVPKTRGGKSQPTIVGKVAIARMEAFLYTFGFMTRDVAYLLLAGHEKNVDALEYYKKWWIAQWIKVNSSQTLGQSEFASHVPFSKYHASIIYLYNILLGMVICPDTFFQNTMPYKEQTKPNSEPTIITFRSDGWYSRLLAQLRQKNQKLPNLKFRPPSGGRPRVGIGTVNGVEKFYKAINKTEQFKPARWEEFRE